MVPPCVYFVVSKLNSYECVSHDVSPVSGEEIKINAMPNLQLACAHDASTRLTATVTLV